MDTAGASIVVGLISLVIALITLRFAYRATRVSERSLDFEQRREFESKQAILEFANPDYQGAVWQGMSFTDHKTAWFNSSVRNRGPAAALDLDWKASCPGGTVDLSHPPRFLLGVYPEQMTLEIPVDEDGEPMNAPIFVEVALTDDENRKTLQWCMRARGSATGDVHAWRLETLDCISLKPMLGPWKGTPKYSPDDRGEK